MWGNSVKTAFKSLWSNKLRSFLTLLGMVIGIYAVVTLLSVAQGVQSQTTELIEGFGTRTMIIIPGETDDSGGVNFASQFAPSTIFVDDAAVLSAKGTKIEKDIDYATFIGGVLRKGDKKLTGLPVGITPGSEELFGVKPTLGRFITDADLATKQKVIFLSEKTLEKLGAAVGEKVFIGTTEFTIEGGFVGKESLSIGQSVDDMYFVPATVANAINQSEQINRMVVRALDANQIEAAKQEVIDILRAKHGTVDFTVQLPSDILGTFNQITDILKYMVVGIASISLLVSGIGISNIMLVTVTERTREIGIRKAVGATEGAIMLQFLIESIVLTIVGTLIGLGLSIITMLVAAKYSPIDPVITTGTVFLAIGMGVLAGVVFGLFPAFRAARKNPVEALRFE